MTPTSIKPTSIRRFLVLSGKRMAILALAVLAGVGVARLTGAAGGDGATAVGSGPDKTNLFEWANPVTDILVGIDQHFFKDPDLKKMREGAVRGMIESLDDPYTEFIPNEEEKDFDKQVRGEYVGIGAEVDTDGGWLKIASPLDDSPAWKAGIEADDLVVAVDGVTTFNLGVEKVIDRLMGEPGSVVRLTIERVGDKSAAPSGALEPSAPADSPESPGPKAGRTRFDLKIIRQKIVTSTVKGLHRVGDTQEWDFMADPVQKIGYIRVTQFTAGTIPELKAACEKLLSQGMRGLVLDLRYNGGGSLNAAIEMADLFLKEGVIVSTKGRRTREERAMARAEGTLPDFPMLIMLNESSASASEVVSGALVDNHRAIALGTRSFGKGIVQTVYRLASGEGQLKVTEAYYYLPSGRCLHRTPESTQWGVDPSPGFYVPMTLDEQREMVRVRRTEEIIRAKGKLAGGEDQQRWSDPAWILDHLKDKQLSAAVKAIQLRMSGDAWQPTGTDAPAGTLEMAELKREQRRYELLERELDRVSRRIDALTTAATDTVKAGDFDPIPGDADLTGGKVLVYDKDGKVVATLNITGPNLDRWLIDAPVKPVATP
jgi:carboxyl-terminal processing protease